MTQWLKDIFNVERIYQKKVNNLKDMRPELFTKNDISEAPKTDENFQKVLSVHRTINYGHIIDMIKDRKLRLVRNVKYIKKRRYSTSRPTEKETQIIAKIEELNNIIRMINRKNKT